LFFLLLGRGQRGGGREGLAQGRFGGGTGLFLLSFLFVRLAAELVRLFFLLLYLLVDLDGLLLEFLAALFSRLLELGHLFLVFLVYPLDIRVEF
jgi:hypothetical protein